MRISDWSSDVCSSDLPKSSIGLDRQGRGLTEAAGDGEARGRGARANPGIDQETIHARQDVGRQGVIDVLVIIIGACRERQRSQRSVDLEFLADLLLVDGRRHIADWRGRRVGIGRKLTAAITVRGARLEVPVRCEGMYAGEIGKR